ncbi:DDE superfamily endonuclease [Phytophthora infestans]|uniref:DDE superfamily endonuclease n=1 Tax=Phytophthora infestans TaxID=4787 RepID=A0A8S9V375_PHYIN|nr:DDE superfamily endonuclease [Phytophthora infestans]
MDGTLIAINRPRDFEGWCNRKGYPSVNVQAVCDHKKRFISFDIRPGSWSDAKIFQYSWFGSNIDRLLPRGHHVLADSGYGVSPAVMTPYSEKDEGGRLTQTQTTFNFNLSSTRMAIEGAFGLLKERFRI